jgi:hypothetical protein
MFGTVSFCEAIETIFLKSKYIVQCSHMFKAVSCPCNFSWLGCFRNKTKIFRFEPKHSETKSVLVDFRFVSRNKKFLFRFVSVCFGSFRYFKPVLKQPKHIDLFRNKPKKPREKQHKN